MNRLVSSCFVLLAGSLFSASGFAAEGIIDLGPEEIIQAGGKDIVVPGYSVPSFEDWNDDQLRDLIIGEGGGGAPGKIRVYLNRGTEADPCFTDYFYAQSNGEDLTVTPEGCLGCFPRLVPWSGLNHKDLLVGLGDGTIRVFRNIGWRDNPQFDLGEEVTVGSSDISTLDVGMRATPLFLDWNNDGLIDVLAGALDGGVHVFYNCGCGTAIPPHFYTSPIDGHFVQANGRDLLVPGGRSSPAIVDADGDGLKDILSGNTDGQILFYKNVGTDTLPMFGGYTMVQSDGKPIDLAGAQRSRPCLCYWTGDGHFGPRDAYWDLLVGYGDGKIRLYRGIPKAGDLNGSGTLDDGDFTILVQALDQPVPPEGSPADLNHDGVVDNLDLRLFADLWLAEHGTEKK
jgi:hypothetical protein